MDKLNVAIVGLGAFGEAFPPIYRAHPGVGDITLFDMSADSVARALRSVGGGARVAGSFEEILSDGSIDAVHLLTPIPLHEEQTVAVLNAGKHCACAVPMATSLDGIRRIAAAARHSGRNYMMMETTLYTYQFLFAKRMAERGEFGRIQFLRGTHWQNMAGWPGYWPGLPGVGGRHSNAELLRRSPGGDPAFHGRPELRPHEPAGVLQGRTWRLASRITPASGARIRLQLPGGPQAADRRIPRRQHHRRRPLRP